MALDLGLGVATSGMWPCILSLPRLSCTKGARSRSWTERAGVQPPASLREAGKTPGHKWGPAAGGTLWPRPRTGYSGTPTFRALQLLLVKGHRPPVSRLLLRGTVT